MHLLEVLLDKHISDLEWGWDFDWANLSMGIVLVPLRLDRLTDVTLVLLQLEVLMVCWSDHRLYRLMVR